MAINWFMTYKLESSLRKHLRSEIINATDSLYDFSFKKLNIGLFSGELMIHGLELFPDSAILQKRELQDSLPNFYFSIDIDTISFTGINLTWEFYYRELSFNEFRLKKPIIKIVSPHKHKIDKTIDSLTNKSLYDIISPYFDVIQAGRISFEDANVEYTVKDTTTSHYKLHDFSFVAHNFSLNKYYKQNSKLLFSDNFSFQTHTPQSVFDSEHFLLNLDEINLNTIDSTIYLGGVHLLTKEPYWEQRLQKPGNYTDLAVGGVEINGIAFSRKDGYNFLDCKEFSIKYPDIEYFDVEDDEPQNNDTDQQSVHKKTEIIKIPSWSLYTLISPIFERLSIETIDVADAKFQYTVTKNKQSDLYTLNKLNFEAYNFVVDSANNNYNMIKYVQDFNLNAVDVRGTLNSNNNFISLDKIELNTIEKFFKISKVELSPIAYVPGKNKIKGSLDEIQIDGIQYDKGLDADKIQILKPNISFIKGQSHITNKKQNEEDDKDVINDLLNSIAPFINYLKVKDIIIKDAKASYIDEKTADSYKLSNLDFYAKNFHIDNETRRFTDYFFSWDEYDFRFRNFDNITPDKKYRIRIADGEFNSITKDILLKGLTVLPLQKDSVSYIVIKSPYLRLLGWNEKAIKQKILSFESFVLENPVIEIVKQQEKAPKENNKKTKGQNTPLIDLELISFDLFDIPSPSFVLKDLTNKNLIDVKLNKLLLDTLKWVPQKEINISSLLVDSPNIDIQKGEDSNATTKKENYNKADLALLGDINLDKINIKHPILNLESSDFRLYFTTDQYLLESFVWKQKQDSILKIGNLDFSNPILSYIDKKKSKKPKVKLENSLNKNKINQLIGKFTNQLEIKRFNISNLNFMFSIEEENQLIFKNKLATTNFKIENLYSDWKKDQTTITELAFSTKDVDYPIADSFYNVQIANIDFSKQKGELNINKIRLNPNYPKFEFAYSQPKGADWFNVQIDDVKLSGVDLSKLLSDSTLLVKNMQVDYVLLENFKNQKIEIEHNKMPLLYEQFQRFPIKYHIDELKVNDFTVLYEELAKSGYQPARIPFYRMNGQVKNFTNIQRNDGSFYTLHADGLLMGTDSRFTAQWKMPVDSINDKFYLSAQIKKLDMTDFNQLITPMAPAYVRSGYIDDLGFHTEASSIGASIDFHLKYDSLYIVLMNNMFFNEENKFYSHIVNKWGVEKESSKDSNIHKKIVRDPYHSNFNYFWQILQPPLIEAVGVSEEKQNFAQNLATIFGKIKKIFVRSTKKEEEEKAEEE